MPPESHRVVETLPVVEERLVVGKTVEETGAVRVRIEIEHREQPVTLEKAVDTVVVERVPVNRIAERRVEPWTEGDVTVVPVYAEYEVVERRLVLVEELRLTKRTTRSSETRVVPLERQRAVVERRLADGRWIPDPADDADGATGDTTDAMRPKP